MFAHDFLFSLCHAYFLEYFQKMLRFQDKIIITMNFSINMKIIPA